MRDRLDAILAASTVVVACLGGGLVTEDFISPTAATIALTIVLFASTATAWVRPGE